MVKEDIRTVVKNGDSEALRLLIQQGVDVNTKNSRGITPLHMAARTGHLDIIRLLVENGADVNAKSMCGQTALDWAKAVRQSQTSNYLSELMK